MEENTSAKEKKYDVLDMQNYRIEKLPKRKKSKFERTLAIVGIPLSIFAFIYFGFFAHLSFLEDIEASTIVASKAKAAFDRLGEAGFARINT